MASCLHLVYLTIFILTLTALGESALYVRNMRARGLKGDVAGNAPDAYVKVFVRGNVAKTSVAYNSFNPSWGTNMKLTAKVNDELKLQVWDKDIKYDDLLGSCVKRVQQGPHRGLSCKLSSGGTLYFDYEFS